MILRRIASAIRRQDWTLVCIEFVLVVTGVIVALQFDNWNANRVLKIQEREILEAFIEDLEANIESFDNNIGFDRESIAACDRVLEVLEVGEDWNHDVALTMGICRGWTSPYLKSFAYQSLKGAGIDLISNRELRRVVSELYETEYEDLAGDTDRGFWEYQHTVMLPAFAEYLVIPPHDEDLGWATRPMFPQDYAALQKSRKFKTVILGKRSHQTVSIRYQKEARQATNAVLQLMKSELNKQWATRKVPE